MDQQECYEIKGYKVVSKLPAYSWTQTPDIPRQACSAGKLLDGLPHMAAASREQHLAPNGAGAVTKHPDLVSVPPETKVSGTGDADPRWIKHTPSGRL